MPKPPLILEQSLLEDDLITTMLAGLKTGRPDRTYPESYSDMQGCVRAVLAMFEVKRRPLAIPLRTPCPDCDGLGHTIDLTDPTCRHLKTCPNCRGRRSLPIDA